MAFVSLAQSIIDQGINFYEIWGVYPSSQGIYFCANEYVFRYANSKVSTIPVDFKVQDAYLLSNHLYLPTKSGMCILNDTTLVPVSKKLSFCLTPWKGEEFLTINGKLELATFNISTATVTPFESQVQQILKEDHPFEIEQIDEDHFLIHIR